MSGLMALSGQSANITVSGAMYYLMLTQTVVAALVLLLFAYLMIRKYLSGKRGQNLIEAPLAAADRVLTGISLDLSAVRRKFDVGEGFDYSGIVVRAHYNGEPSDDVLDFTVEAPKTDVAGNYDVIVRHGNFSAKYSIEVVDQEPRYEIAMDIDASETRTQFAVGEAFDSDGLKVYMRYNLEPYFIQVYDFTVDAPSTDDVGEKAVYVRRGGFVATYTVAVSDNSPQGATQNAVASDAFGYYDAPAQDDYSQYYEQPLDAALDFSEQTPADNLRADRSFYARLCQSDRQTKTWYAALKREIMAFDGVKARLSWRRETFKVNGEQVAKFGFRGDTICLFLALDPAKYDGTRYKVEQALANGKSDDLPLMYRVKNEKRFRLAFDLIDEAMLVRGVIKGAPAEVEIPPYQSEGQLIADGYIKFKSRSEENIFTKRKNDDEA